MSPAHNIKLSQIYRIKALLLNLACNHFKSYTWLISSPTTTAPMKTKNPKKISTKRIKVPTSQDGTNSSSKINSKEPSDSAASNIPVKYKSKPSHSHSKDRTSFAKLSLEWEKLQSLSSLFSIKSHPMEIAISHTKQSLHAILDSWLIKSLRTLKD